MLLALVPFLLALVSTGWSSPCEPGGCDAVNTVTQVTSALDAAAQPKIQSFFSPFDEVESEVLRQLDTARTEVMIAHYNIRREAVLQKLVELSQRGVKVRVAVDQTNAAHAWNTGDDFLERNGIQVVRTKPSGSTSLMHLKVAVIDGEKVMTGSFNWNATASLANDENMLLVHDRKVAQYYRDEVLEVLGDKPSVAGNGKISDSFEVHFSPEERLDTVIAAQIDKAKKSIRLAMFTLTDRKVQDALVKAAQRGVDVQIVVEQKQASSSATDEYVEEAGGKVIRASNRVGSFSAMHQKYCVIDGNKVMTGASNWTKNGTRYSNEDIAIIDSPELAGQYLDNFADLQHVYGGIDGGNARSVSPVLFHAQNDETMPGDRVFVVGSDPRLGAWDPYKGVELQTADDLFPDWTGNVLLSPGERVEYKIVTVKADGSVRWEDGPNRVFETDANGRAQVIAGEYGDTSKNWTPEVYGETPRAIPSYLVTDGKGGYTSPGGLHYGADKAYGNRAAHVLGHLEDSGEKSAQGVYTVAEADIFPLIDKAWADSASNRSKYLVETQGDRLAYEFPIGRTIGYVGGQDGARSDASTLRVVVEGSDVVTAFPVAPVR